MVLCMGFVNEMVLITPAFWLLWAVLTQHQGLHVFPTTLLSFTPSKWAGSKQEVGRGHSWESWSKLAKYINAVPYNSAIILRVEREKGRGLSSNVVVAWLDTDLLVMGGLCVTFCCFLQLLNRLYLDPRVFLFLLFPSRTGERNGGGASGWLGAWLLTGINSPQLWVQEKAMKGTNPCFNSVIRVVRFRLLSLVFLPAVLSLFFFPKMQRMQWNKKDIFHITSLEIRKLSMHWCMKRMLFLPTFFVCLYLEHSSSTLNEPFG